MHIPGFPEYTPASLHDQKYDLPLCAPHDDARVHSRMHLRDGDRVRSRMHPRDGDCVRSRMHPRDGDRDHIHMILHGGDDHFYVFFLSILLLPYPFPPYITYE